MIRSLTLLPLLGIALAGLAACNNSAGTLTPEQAAPVAGGSAALPHDPASVLLSAGTLHLDLDAGLATLEPDRQALAIGDTYSELGLAPAFNGDFGQNFRVIGLRRTGPTSIEVTFETKHPFSPALRPDLAIFNLKAWIVSSQNAVNLNGVDIAPGLVTNATGYGRMWTDTALSQPGSPYATVQPYVMLNEDRSNAPFIWQQPAGWNVLFPGMVTEDAVELEIGTATQLSLRVYLTADYGQSAVRATRQNPEYSLPQFAGNAPWRVEVTELSNDLEAGQTASSASFRVDIWDWKHGSGLGSDVALATLQIPGVTAAPSTLTLTGSGQDADPLTASTLVLNGLGAPEGDYWGLVEVTDQSTSGTGLLEDLRTPIAITQYRTWQVFPVSVDDTSLPPAAAFVRCFGGTVKIGLSERFDASGSTPGTHPIAAYEWDFDYDGSTFDVDATGVEVVHGWATGGTYTVALRVSDGLGGEDTATAPIDVSGLPAWEAAQRLTTNTLPEFYYGFGPTATTAMAMTADGHVHLVYPQITGVFPSMTFEHYHVEYGGCPPQMNTPQLISTTANVTNWQWNVSLAATGNTLHAAYTNAPAGSYPNFRHMSYTNGVWTHVGAIGTGNAYWSGGHIAAAPDGSLAFAGKRREGTVCPGIPGPAMPVYFSRFTAGAWTPLQQIGDRYVVLASSSCGGYTLSDPDMHFVATPDNEWLAVWAGVAEQYDGFTSITGTYTVNLKWNRTTGGVWGTQSDLFTTVNRNARTNMRRSPNGMIWLATGIGSQSTIAMAQYDNTAWTPLTTVQTITSGSHAFPQIAFNNAGRGVLLYSHSGSTTTLLWAKHFEQTHSLSTVASVPQTVVEAGAFARPVPQIAPMGNEGFLAMWDTAKYGSTTSERELDWTRWQ